jgi:hypothetical protein
LVEEVIDLLKSTVGVEVFSLQYASTQKAITARKDKRKQAQALQV